MWNSLLDEWSEYFFQMSPLDLSHSVNVASTTSHPDCANKGAEYCSDQASTAAHAQLSPINNVSGNDKTMSISQGCSSEESMSADHRCSSDASMNSDQRCGSLSPVIGDTDRNDDVVLFEFTFRQLMLLTIGAPLCALVASFVIGFSTDYDVLLNYEWTCGVSIAHWFCFNAEHCFVRTGIYELSQRTAQPNKCFLEAKLYWKLNVRWNCFQIPPPPPRTCQFTPIYSSKEIIMKLFVASNQNNIPKTWCSS